MGFGASHRGQPTRYWDSKRSFLPHHVFKKKEINNLPTKGVLIDPFPRMKSLMSSTTFCELTGVSPKAPVASRRSLMMGMAMVMVLMMLVVILILVLCRWHPPSILNLPCPCLLQNQFPPVRKQQNLPALQRRKQRAQRASPRKFHQEAVLIERPRQVVLMELAPLKHLRRIPCHLRLSQTNLVCKLWWSCGSKSWSYSVCQLIYHPSTWIGGVLGC